MNLKEFISTKLIPITSKITSNKYLISIKNGFTFSMPFLIAGSFVLLLVNLPLDDPNTFLYQQWYVNIMNQYKDNFVQPFYVTLEIMSIFVVFGIGHNLSKQYNISGTTGGFLSIFTFLILSGQSNQIIYGGDTIKWAILPGSSFPVIDARYLGAKGIFTGILSAILSVEIYRFSISKKITINLPTSIPPAIAKSFEALIPVIIMMIIAQTINITVQSTTKNLVPEVIMNLFKPLLYITDTLVGTLIIVFIIQILWFFGLHGSHIIGAVLYSITLTNIELNASALSENLPIPHILTLEFLGGFAFIGGCGSTLGLSICMLISKNQHLKTIGKLSFIPGLFNINEPITFGCPIVLNPILGIPFIVVPLINTTIAYSLTNLEFIEKTKALVPWTTPSPLLAFISTGLDFKALIWSLLLLLLSTIIYLPFLKGYEKVILKQGQES